MSDAATLPADKLSPADPLGRAFSTAQSGMAAGAELQKKGIEDESKAIQDERKLRETQAADRKDYDAAHPFPHPDIKPWTAKPPENNPVERFGSWASAFGLLAGAITKTGLTSSLNASAAAMNAFRKNDMDAYEESKSAWKDNIKIATEQAQWEEKAYEHGWNLMEKNQAEGITQLQLAAKQAENTTMMGLLQRGQFKEAFDLYMGIKKFANDSASIGIALEDHAVKMEDQKSRLELLTRAYTDDAKKTPDQQMSPERKAQLRTQIMNPQYTINQAKTLAETGSAASSMASDPITIDYWAKRVRAGEPMPSLGIGKDAALSRRLIAEKAAHDAYEEGDTAATDIVKRATLTAEKGSLTKLVAQQNAIHQFEQTAVANGRVLVGLADRVDSTGVPVLERWLRGGKKAISGDEDVTKFDAQLGVYLPEVAKILSNPNMTGVLSDAARDEAKVLVDRNFTADQIKSVVPLLEQDFGRRDAAIKDEVKIVQDTIGQLADKNFGKKTDGATDHPAVPADLTTKSDLHWSPSTKTWWWKENGEDKSRSAE